MDLRVCDQCGKNISAHFKDCPFCQREPAAQPAAPMAESDNSGTFWMDKTTYKQPPKPRTKIGKNKACKYCGESILAVAAKCKHCGSNLTNQPNAQPDTPAADYGPLLLGIPVVGVILVEFWISGMTLIQFPGDKMSLILLATILCTAGAAALEASKVGMESDRERGTYSPTAWLFLIMIMWVLCYPIYLYKRKAYGLKNHLLAGILITLAFITSWSAMSYSIEKNKSEVRTNLEQIQKIIAPFQQAR